jgi:hypothetical protein
LRLQVSHQPPPQRSHHAALLLRQQLLAPAAVQLCPPRLLQLQWCYLWLLLLLALVAH